MAGAKNIAVFVSGTGTTLQTLIDSQLIYGYHIAVVVANRECGAIARAEEAGIPTLQSKDWESIDNTLQENGVGLVVLAGFLAIIPHWICEKWDQRIINLHPSLLPKHGGKGMYGHHVHEAVKAAGETRSGITIHYVNEVYDSGTIIFQAQCDITPNDTPDDIAQKVHILEMEHYPKVTEKLLKDLNTL
jgi:phosphoribosylglycinamide formyltransferase-1